MRTCFQSLIAMLLITATAWAHPGHDHGTSGLRTWTESRGTKHEASFVSAREGKVQLRKRDGQLLTVQLDRLSRDDQHWIEHRQTEIRRLNERRPATTFVSFADPKPTAAAAEVGKAFEPFVKTKAITTRSDERFFYVESSGMPDHPLMIGIRAWQQQVPLPQMYTGDNAWRIPIFPTPAAQPASAKNRFLRGAIALAVNGVPIFNPLNNRGDDAFLFGELDDYGGHCGRADDYHYHIAPVHLEKTVGKGAVIAYALDGYPIYGYDEPDGSKVVGLDGLNGHKDAAGRYHYHATKTYPYLNGGFYGEVVERDGQVDPQPRAQPVREYLPPLPGAKIIDFKATAAQSYQLTYDVGGKPGYVRYSLVDDGAVKFTFVDPQGKSKSETYAPGKRRPGAGGGDRRPRPGEARKPWIAEHFAELDGDKNRVLSRSEMLAEATRTFAAYDTSKDGRLTRDEYDRGGVKSAFAGFVRGHATEVDVDGDGIITKQELLDFAGKLFDKADRNRDGKTTAEEASVQGPDKR